MSAHILVVEDDGDSRQAICVMLDALGYTPRAFTTGDEALEALRKDSADSPPIALALLDIMLPGMNGYEVLQALKAMPRFERVPVIMVTAKDGDSEIIDGYKYGADYYITKPFTAKQLEYGMQLYLPRPLKQ